MLLYGPGIRATECATLTEANTDIDDATIRVVGKGRHERVLPLNVEVVRALWQYRQVRGRVAPAVCFFRIRSGGALSRGSIY